MSDIEQKRRDRRERYLRDPLPMRLGNLASNLSRVKSLSNHSAMSEAAGRVVDESIFFIEWTAADANLQQQAELDELRSLLMNWRLEWTEIWNDLEKRTSVAEQAGAWSEKILDRSGLLKTQDR